MSTGVKVALIGCGVLFVVVIVAFGVGGYFVKRFVGEGIDAVKNVAGSDDSEYGKKVAELQKEYPFNPSSDGVITDDQLQRFLNVRKALYGVYQNHAAELEKLKNSSNPDFGSAIKGFSMIKDLRVAQAQALQEQHMSPDEYKYMVSEIYVTWATKVTKDVAPAMASAAEGLKKSLDQLDHQLADPNLSETAKEQLKRTKETLQSQLDAVPKNVDKELESVPKQNIELFTKYQKEIAKYSMAGLELIGF
jgi:hypothetical protein